MQISFSKYHGTGNDFIIIQDTDKSIMKCLNEDIISSLCHRRMGIGADGLILIQDHDQADFEMVYYNADGGLSSMCGNGGRCSAWFAYVCGMASERLTFKAVDGLHSAHCSDDHYVDLEMRPVKLAKKWDDDHIIDTGSPHYVQFVDDLDFDIVKSAKQIRYSDHFKKEGINVNFVKENEGYISLRTYERGVEDETLSCGTGVTACALVWSYLQEDRPKKIAVHAVGGQLEVRYNEIMDNFFTDVWLSGPLKKVYDGKFLVDA